LSFLKDSHISPQAVELTGCRPFTVESGFSLGDLGEAGHASGLVIAALPGAGSAQACAADAWRLWLSTRQNAGPSGSGLPITEERNPATLEIDRLPVLEVLRLINQEDSRVPRAVGSQIPRIAQAVEQITARMERGGRMIYIGAGTSGRIGVLDASEIPPTYGASPDLVVAVIAGGDESIRHSLEGVEDDTEDGARTVNDLQVSEHDTVIGLAASGRTPYVLGGMAAARDRGALTISIACNSPSPMEELADISIAPLVGPEVITGSTRMKAGTAQKLILNMISTAVMVRLGKTYSNLMVDVQTTNTKLHQRARRIVAQACEVNNSAAEEALAAAEEALAASGGEVKTAIVALKAGITPDEARTRLAKSGGNVRAALELSQGSGA
jgi:N-acetylmuramic acid 6-phosphate etherase